MGLTPPRCPVGLDEDFGICTNHGECTAACPKAIPLDFIAGLNRDLIRAAFYP